LLKVHKLSDASKGFTAALSMKYEGPYTVTKKCTDSIYEISCPVSNKVIGKHHISQLTSYNRAFVLRNNGFDQCRSSQYDAVSEAAQAVGAREEEEEGV